MYQHIDFIGPLDSAAQSWSDEIAATDRAAALSEAADQIIARRQASIDELHAACLSLLLTGLDRTAAVVAIGAVAERRALDSFLAAEAATCVDCLVFGAPCARHNRRSGRSQPSWHRFGSS